MEYLFHKDVQLKGVADVQQMKQEIIQIIEQMDDKTFLDFVWGLRNICIDHLIERRETLEDSEIKNIEGLKEVCQKILDEYEKR